MAGLLQKTVGDIGPSLRQNVGDFLLARWSRQGNKFEEKGGFLRYFLPHLGHKKVVYEGWGAAIPGGLSKEETRRKTLKRLALLLGRGKKGWKPG